MNAAPTLMVMAGGTGGHIFPALAVAHWLRAAGWSVVWMGSPAGMEARLVPAQGFEMETVEFAGVRGKGWRRLLRLPPELARAIVQCIATLRRRRPDVVLGMGGYIAFPGGVAAALLRCPLVIHEQNSVPGMTNRWLARIADRVLAAFPAAFGTNTRAQWTGNPVREAITRLQPPPVRYAGREGPLRLLVIGGSLGARALNECLPQALARLPGTHRPVVVHQAGRDARPALERAYAQAGVSATVVEFIDDMAARYGEADLVVARAGATTVAELACAGLPAVLVPYPHAVDDHQTVNARFLSERGAAWLLPQAELTPASLATLLESAERPVLLEMACRAREAARSDATERVAQACVELANARMAGGRR